MKEKIFLSEDLTGVLEKIDRWYNDSELYCDGDICDINIKLKSTSSCDPKLIEEQCPYIFSTHLYEAIVRY